jgi:hypothetical protein
LRNFLVPMPHVTSFAELNVRLLECCRRRWSDRLRDREVLVRGYVHEVVIACAADELARSSLRA